MRQFLLLLVIVGSLAGLGVVQYRLLQTGIRAERSRFDREVQLALQEVRVQWQGGGPLPAAVSRAVTAAAPDSLRGALETYLTERLARRGIDAAYTFAITGEQSQRAYVHSATYDPTTFEPWTYSVLLDGYPAQRCACLLYLHLDIPNLYSYLLGSLADLLIPLVLFLLLILAGLAYLIYLLARRRRLQAVQNDFINNLTHELKTPVFSISVAAKVLRRSLGDGTAAKAGEYLDLIERENQKLKGHIDKVLELASLESTTYRLDRQLIDPAPVVARVVANFRYRAAERGGTVTLAADAPTRRLSVDEMHFVNVIENLLDNALKYGPPGGTVVVRTAVSDDHWHLYVRDQGPGIARAEQGRIFDKFYRVSQGDLHPVKGFGLGLHYVRAVVRAHGGGVGVADAPGGGAVFHVRLPLGDLG